MTKHWLARLVWPVGICVSVVMLTSVKHVNADDDDRGDDARIRRGLEIAPVHLNIHEDDWRAVGLGSYLVNAAMGCNDCHSAGPQTQY